MRVCPIPTVGTAEPTKERLEIEVRVVAWRGFLYAQTTDYGVFGRSDQIEGVLTMIARRSHQKENSTVMGSCVPGLQIENLRRER